MTDHVEERRATVGVIGDGALAPGDEKVDIGERVGERLIDAGYRIVCGGLGGVMEAVCRGAQRSESYFEGCTVGILPGDEHRDANAGVDVALPTGFGHGRNMLVAQSDALVAIGGGAGTLSEMAFGWIMKRLIVALRVEGWSGRLADERIDPRERLPGIDDDRVFGADSAAEVVAELDARLGAYREARR